MQAARIAMSDLWVAKPKFTEKDYPDLTGKVYIVTGATSGLGKIAAQLLAGQNAKVYLHGRSQSKLDAALSEIKEANPDADVHGVIFDLADLPTIKPGLEPFLKAESKLHGVILNAGVMIPPAGSTTKQGYELQHGTNNIGHMVVQRLLDEKIISTAKGEPEGVCRIVWLSSSGHSFSPPTGVDWNTETNRPETAGKSQMVLYGQSKAINIFQGAQWAKHHPGSNVLSISIHPGVLSTDLARSTSSFSQRVTKCILYPPKNGTYTELFALLYPDYNSFKVFDDDDLLFIVPFGQVKKNLLRSDVGASAVGSVGATVWDYLQRETDSYI